jgi:predicted nucleotidyltransferase
MAAREAKIRRLHPLGPKLSRARPPGALAARILEIRSIMTDDLDNDGDQFGRLVDLVVVALGPNLLSVVQFGSSVDGVLKPASDLDLLAVVDRSLDDERRRTLTTALALRNRQFFPRPVEVAVVVVDDVVPWRYPATMDYLYGDWLDDIATSGPPQPRQDPNLPILVTQALSMSRPD